MCQSEKLGLTLLEKSVVFLIPVITTVIGYFLKPIVNLIQHVPVLSDFTLVRLVHEFEASWLIWVLTILGFAIGIVLSLFTYEEILKLNVSRNHIDVSVHEKHFKIEKGQFGSVFKEGKKLFIFDNKGRELLCEPTDHKAEKVAEVFEKFGYRWKSSDPYHREYFEWKIDDERLSTRANDILYKRKEALRAGDEKHSKVLKDDLNEINIYVKDENDKQFVRFINAGEVE